MFALQWALKQQQAPLPGAMLGTSRQCPASIVLDCLGAAVLNLDLFQQHGSLGIRKALRELARVLHLVQPDVVKHVDSGG